MNIEKKYYKELEKFQKYCMQLQENGGSYFVVIVNHELYRFLYPYEPYEKFENIDPVNFVYEKIVSLNIFLEQSFNSICFYDFDVKKSGTILSSTSSLEKKTSDVYTSLWNEFSTKTLLDESRKLLTKRIPVDIIERDIKGKVILDMGCGSGRYSLALSMLGAKKVYAVDLFAQSYQESKEIAKKESLNIEFSEANFHNLPFKDEKFDFVFSNGTIHHSTSIKKSLKEYKRVLKNGKKGFLYIYADKGIFWNTRKIMRKIFKNIPIEYTNSVLKMMGMPQNRFIFSDVWHVPIETHTTKNELEGYLKKYDFSYDKLISKNKFDLDYAISIDIKDAKVMWGDGEHRYILGKN